MFMGGFFKLHMCLTVSFFLEDDLYETFSGVQNLLQYSIGNLPAPQIAEYVFSKLF